MIQPGLPQRPSNVQTLAQRIRLVNASPYFHQYKHALLAATQWANADGVIRPSVETWARAMGRNRNQLSGVITRMIRDGVIEPLTTRKGGRAGPAHYRILMFAPGFVPPQEWFDRVSELTPATDNPRAARDLGPGEVSRFDDETLALSSDNLRAFHAQPSRGAIRTQKNNCEQTNATEGVVVEKPCRDAETADNRAKAMQGAVRAALVNEPSIQLRGGDIVSQLPLALQQHANATPERVAWINAEAPSKNNPQGWAATAIRDGYEVPVEKIPPKPVVPWAMDVFQRMLPADQVAWTNRGQRLARTPEQFRKSSESSWSWIGIAMRAAIAWEALLPMDEGTRSTIMREAQRRNRDASRLAESDPHLLKIVWGVLVDRGVITQQTMPPQLVPSLRLVGDEGAA